MRFLKKTFQSIPDNCYTTKIIKFKFMTTLNNLITFNGESEPRNRSQEPFIYFEPFYHCRKISYINFFHNKLDVDFILLIRPIRWIICRKYLFIYKRLRVEASCENYNNIVYNLKKWMRKINCNKYNTFFVWSNNVRYWVCLFSFCWRYSVKYPEM